MSSPRGRGAGARCALLPLIPHSCLLSRISRLFSACDLFLYLFRTRPHTLPQPALPAPYPGGADQGGLGVVRHLSTHGYPDVHAAHPGTFREPAPGWCKGGQAARATDLSVVAGGYLLSVPGGFRSRGSVGGPWGRIWGAASSGRVGCRAAAAAPLLRVSFAGVRSCAAGLERGGVRHGGSVCCVGPVQLQRRRGVAAWGGGDENGETVFPFLLAAADRPVFRLPRVFAKVYC